MKIVQLVAAAAVCALFALLVFRIVSVDRTAVASAGRAAPDFRLPLLASHAHGRMLSLQSLRGRPVVLNFWASWCDPCRRESGLLARAAHSNPGVAFVGVNVHDFRSAARAFVRSHHVAYPVVASPSERLIAAYGLANLPETYYLDRSGRIVGRTRGEVTAAALGHGLRLAERG